MSVGIDPVKRFQVGLERIRGNPNPTATKLPITEVTLNPNENYFTPYGMNRRYASKNFGRTVYLELPNCPHRCWWCYVDPRNLGGDVYSEMAREIRRKAAENGDLPWRLVEDPRINIEDTFEHYSKLYDKSQFDALCMGSSEPLGFLPQIAAYSELVKQHGIPYIIGIDSTGFQLAHNPKLVDRLEGLEDIVHFVIATFKGRNPTEHHRVTTSLGGYNWDAGIQAQDILLRKGFWTIPAGITLNTFAHPNDETFEVVASMDPKFVKDGKFTNRYREFLADKTAEWLHDQLSLIHPDYPRLLHFNKLTYGRVKAPKYQIQRKKAAGFENCKPSVFEEALKRVFERRGTPIIEYTKKQYSTSHPQYIEVMRQVIDDKAGTRKSQQLTTIEGLDL